MLFRTAPPPFPAQLRQARLDAGYTSLYAAAMGTGFSSGQLSEWEAGKVSPTVASARRLAEAYGMRLEIAFKPTRRTRK